MNNAIEFKGVSFSYEENSTEPNYALEDVSFCVKEGEYVALIGHNGSGKSTIAKIISGILDAGEGVYIFGEQMDDKNVMRLQKMMGMVFQNPDNQFIGATVQDDIAFGLENDQIPQDQMINMIADYAKRVGMSEFLEREPGNLSGGQKQRVAIAGTLVRNPRILLLDEATSMLDPQGRREITALIKTMKEENPNLTILSITHDIEEAFQSDKVIVMNKGKIEMAGTPSEVFINFDRLKEINLDIPFFMRLSEELANVGIDITGVNTLKGLVKKLCR